MALDSAAKRAAAAGVGRPYMRGIVPVATPTEEWRVSVGNAYPVADLTDPGGGGVDALDFMRGKNRGVGHGIARGTN